jgi:hypothetical protein
MSRHSHHHRKHRKSNSVGAFFRRLFGREIKKSSSRSHFPGINLPGDYDPAEFRRKSQEEELPGFIDEAGNEIERKEFYQDTPEFLGSAPGIKKESKKRRPSLKDKINLYFKLRDLRREERMKEKLKRKHRREIQEDYRKMNAGPGLGKKLFTMSEEGGESEKEKKLPLFSQQNPFFRNLTIAGNSLMIFLITYVLVYLFYWLTSMMVASVYGLDSILYYYDLEFNNHSQLWDRFNILMVTGIPPFFCLFLGIFLYKIIFKIPRFAGLQKLFVLWSAFHLINHFFGAFPSGIVTDEGFGYVAAWMYMNTAFKFLFSLIFLFILGVIGFHSAKHILETSDSLHRIKASNRLPFMLYQMAFPWLAGTIILLLVRIPHNFDYPYETLMFFTMAFLVIPAFFNEKVKPELNLMKVKKRRSINIGYVAMMLGLILFLRIMLGIGLHFIIEINVSISPAFG